MGGKTIKEVKSVRGDEARTNSMHRGRGRRGRGRRGGGAGAGVLGRQAAGMQCVLSRPDAYGQNVFTAKNTEDTCPQNVE